MTIYFYKVCNPYGCFSNFSLHSIEMEGTTWVTVEHYYQAQKFIGSPDAAIIPEIYTAQTPDIAAALGRDCRRRLRPDWDVVKTQIMQKAVYKKFLTHIDIREVLLQTGEELIVEDSPCDYFWGCGADKSGQNYLGKILMHVRSELYNVCSKHFSASIIEKAL